MIVRDRSGDRLGMPLPARAGKYRRQIHAIRAKPAGATSKGQERGNRHQLLMGMNREVGADREDDTDEAGEQGRANQQHASTPAPSESQGRA